MYTSLDVQRMADRGQFYLPEKVQKKLTTKKAFADLEEVSKVSKTNILMQYWKSSYPEIIRDENLPPGEKVLKRVALMAAIFGPGFNRDKLPIPQKWREFLPTCQEFYRIEDVPDFFKDVPVSTWLHYFDNSDDAPWETGLPAEEQGKKWRIRDEIQGSFASHYYQQLLDLIAQNKIVAVVNLVEEVSLYHADLRYSIERAFQDFEGKFNKVKGPVKIFTKKALMKIFDEDLKGYKEILNNFIKANFERLSELAKEDESKQIIAVLEQLTTG